MVVRAIGTLMALSLAASGCSSLSCGPGKATRSAGQPFTTAMPDRKQYTCLRFTETLLLAGLTGFVGSVAFGATAPMSAAGTNSAASTRI